MLVRFDDRHCAGDQGAAPFLLESVPAAMVALSAFLVFGLQREAVAYPVLAAGIAFGFLGDRDLGRSLLLIGLGITPIGLISVAADIRWSHYFLVAGVLAVAVLTPYLLDRYVLGRHAIRFPFRSGRHWTLSERIYMFSVSGWPGLSCRTTSSTPAPI